MCCSWDGLVVRVRSLPVFRLLPASSIARAAVSMFSHHLYKGSLLVLKVVQNSGTVKF